MKHGTNMSNTEMVRKMLAGERPFVQVGYTGDKYAIHKVGEKWTDSKGKTWIQKEYGPVSDTPIMDIIRAENNLVCSCCKREIRWGSRQDAKMHAKTGKCLDCLVEEETDMRVKGTYKTYEKKKILENELSRLIEMKKYLVDGLEYLKEHKTFTFVNSNGLVEEWKNEARNEVMGNVKKDHVKCLKEIKRVEKELKKINDEISPKLTPT